jgi:hypothetical protein
MPIVGDAAKVKAAMKKTYGDDWEKVFYATANKEGRKAENWKKKSAAQKLAALPGGLADGKPDSEFPQEQLHEGVETEAEEHGGSPEIAKDIAKDHLVEDNKYYDHLEKMEQLGDRINKIAALVPQRAPGVGGVEGPLKLVDQQTGQPPTMAPTGPPAAPGAPTAAPAAGAPQAGAPKLPSPPGVAPVPPGIVKTHAELIRNGFDALRLRGVLREV